MSNLYNRQRIADAAPDMLSALNEVMLISRMDTTNAINLRTALGGELTTKIKDVVVNASPLDPDDFREIRWTRFDGIIERQSIIHVTYGDESSTLCSKMVAKQGDLGITTWVKGNPDPDTNRCKCCANRSNYMFINKTK